MSPPPKTTTNSGTNTAQSATAASTAASSAQAKSETSTPAETTSANTEQQTDASDVAADTKEFVQVPLNNSTSYTIDDLRQNPTQVLKSKSINITKDQETKIKSFIKESTNRFGDITLKDIDKTYAANPVKLDIQIIYDTLDYSYTDYTKALEASDESLYNNIPAVRQNLDKFCTQLYKEICSSDRNSCVINSFSSRKGTDANVRFGCEFVITK